MCTGMELLALAGTAASAVGGMEQQKEAAANARRQADARNEQLSRTLAKNDQLAQESRDAYNQRQQNATADKIQQSQQDKTAERNDTIQKAVQPAGTTAADISLAGSAPTVVKSELAKKMTDVMNEGKANAQRLATLGGYGDSWLDQGFQDVNAGRTIGQNANFAQGNMAILPYKQDIAEERAYKPISPIGGLLQGFGSLATSYAGSQAGVPKKSYNDPWAGMRTAGVL